MDAVLFAAIVLPSIVVGRIAGNKLGDSGTSKLVIGVVIAAAIAGAAAGVLHLADVDYLPF